MFVSASRGGGGGRLDKHPDVNMTAWDKDLMVLGLLIDGRQRGHRLSSGAGTDRAARV